MSKNTQEPVTLTVGKDGKLEITGRTEVSLSGSTKTEFLIDPKPISLKVSTDTDVWAVLATSLVGLSGLVLAGMVAWFTHRGAKQAADASDRSAKQAAVAVAAGIRNEWMKDLRKAAAEVYALGVSIAMAINVKKGEHALKKWEASFVEWKMHAGTLVLMLDPKKPAVSDLLSAIERVESKVLDNDFDESIEALNEFMSKVAVVLEDAWQDIKNDLYGAAKSKQAVAI